MELSALMGHATEPFPLSRGKRCHALPGRKRDGLKLLSSDRDTVSPALVRAMDRVDLSCDAYQVGRAGSGLGLVLPAAPFLMWIVGIVVEAVAHLPCETKSQRSCWNRYIIANSFQEAASLQFLKNSSSSSSGLSQTSARVSRNSDLTKTRRPLPAIARKASSSVRSSPR
jgi:hypothetical protein